VNTTPVRAVWDGRVPACTEPGLSSCLDEQRLTLDGVLLTVSPLEVDALRLVEHAVAQGRSLVLCPADPLAPLAALIPAAVHTASITEGYRRHNLALGSARHVAVVTREYRIRGQYRGLGVRGRPGSGSAPMYDVVPAATLGRAGSLHVLGRGSDQDGAGWSTLFADSVADLARVPRVDLVVVELPAPDPDAILELRVPVVVVAKDPADPAVTRLAGHFPVFAWDDADVRATARLTPRLVRRAGGAGCEVAPIVDQAVCENAGLFWQDLDPLVRLGRRSPLTRELAREAFGLFYDLVGLALPLPTYEELAGDLVEERVRALGRAARLTGGEVRDLYLPMVEAELAGIAAALRAGTGKHEVLTRLLGDHLDEHRDTLLVARTAALARVYATHLSAVGLQAVRVTSMSTLAGEPPGDVAVLTGMAPRWARWVYRCGVASTVQVLAYTPEGRSDAGPVNFSEAELVRRSVALQQNYEEWLARPAAKARSWGLLTGTLVEVDDDRPAPPGVDPTVVPLVEPPAPPEVPPGLWTAGGWLAPLETGPTMATDATLRTTADTVIAARRVRFSDGRWALLEADGTVRRWRPGVGQVDPAYPVTRLQPGDQLVFIDGDGHKDLLDKVVEVAAEIPALAVAAGWVGHWHHILKQAKDALGSFAALGRALRARGCRVQDQTIRLWVVGVTIGPDDPGDVRRLGEVTGDTTLLDHHAEVHRAIRTLRGAHYRLGRWLIRLEQQHGPAAATGRVDVDEVVDERSGLTAGDFQHSIELATVVSLEAVGNVPRVLTGRLRAAQEETG
jgi:hypothetical protein